MEFVIDIEFIFLILYMWLDILKAIYFFLPAGLASFWPPVLAKTPGFKYLNWPMDFGLTFRKKRVFGTHKTWRGLITGIVASVIMCWIQKLLMGVGFFEKISLVDYNRINIFWWGAVMCAGAMFGVVVKSFFNRQVGVASGRSWFPWDQLDYIFGGIIFSLVLVRLEWWYYVLILILYFVLHLLTKIVGYWVGVNNDYI